MAKIEGYQFRDSFLKTSMRANLLEVVRERFSPNYPFHAFTLPGTRLSFENDLHELFPKASLVGVEKDQKIFTKAKNVIAANELPMKLYNCLDHEYWEKTDDAFDFVWLDYCGPWSKSKFHVLQNLVQGKHLKSRKTTNPIVAVTLLFGMDFHLINSLRLSMDSHARKYGWDGEELKMNARLCGIPLLLNEEAKKKGKSAVPVMVYYYHDKFDTRKSCPMMLMVFEIVNGKKRINPEHIPIVRTVGDFPV